MNTLENLIYIYAKQLNINVKNVTRENDGSIIITADIKTPMNAYLDLQSGLTKKVFIQGYDAENIYFLIP